MKKITLFLFFVHTIFASMANVVWIDVYVQDEDDRNVNKFRLFEIDIDDDGNGSGEGIIWEVGTSKFYLYNPLDALYLGGYNINLEWDKTQKLNSRSDSPRLLEMKVEEVSIAQNIKARIDVRNYEYFITLIDPSKDAEVIHEDVDFLSAKELPNSEMQRLFIEKPYYVSSMKASWSSTENNQHWCSFDKFGSNIKCDLLAPDNIAGAKTVMLCGKKYVMLEDLCPVNNDTNKIDLVLSNEERGYNTGNLPKVVSFDIKDFEHTFNPNTGTTDILISDLLKNDGTISKIDAIDINDKDFSTDTYYDLNGKRLNSYPSSTGIYIRNRNNSSQKILITK